YAAHNKMDNIIATIDYNGAQIDGPTEQILSLGNLAAKWEAFGWDVLEIKYGNDMAAVVRGLDEAKSCSGKSKPVMILLHTEMGHGVDFMMGSHKWHGIAPNDEQLAAALAHNAETSGDLYFAYYMKKYTYTEAKDTRSGFGAGLLEAGRQNEQVVALCADLIGSLKMNDFIKEFPDRFFQIGIAEANMMGIAAGLTIGGKIP